MSAPSEGNLCLGRFRAFTESLRCRNSPDNVRASFEDIVSGASVVDVGPLLLELIAETSGSREVRQLVGWFASLKGDRDDQGEAPSRVAGHPAETLRRENEAIGPRVELCRAAMKQMSDSANTFDQVRYALKELSEVDAHYRREEFLLFTRLERHGLERPGRILWAAHDEIRQWLRYLDLQFAEDGFCANKLVALADSVVGPLLDDIEWMIRLEECILLPMACRTLNEADWQVIWRHSSKIGWCLVEPGFRLQPTPYRPSGKRPQHFPNCHCPRVY